MFKTRLISESRRIVEPAYRLGLPIYGKLVDRARKVGRKTRMHQIATPLNGHQLRDLGLSPTDLLIEFDTDTKERHS